MIFIRFLEKEEGIARVEAYGKYTNQFPQDDENVLFVEDNHKFPSHEEYEGKTGILYINPSTKEMWYEFVDRPFTSEEQIEQLKKQLQTTQNDLGSTLFESAIDKAKITDLEITQGEMLMEIAMLKMGGAL